MQSMGKAVIILGVVMVGIGVLLMFFDRIPFLGKLPGDIHIKRENFQFFFPITSSIIISLLISALSWLFTYFKGK
jgi:hypothetical protein